MGYFYFYLVLHFLTLHYSSATFRLAQLIILSETKPADQRIQEDSFSSFQNLRDSFLESRKTRRKQLVQNTRRKTCRKNRTSQLKIMLTLLSYCVIYKVLNYSFPHTYNGEKNHNLCCVFFPSSAKSPRSP